MAQPSPPNFDRIFTDGVTGSFLISVEEIGKLGLPSGRVFACDPFMELDQDGPVAFGAIVAPGSYPVHVARVQRLDSPYPRVVAVKLAIADEPVTAWELDTERPGYGVDAGAGCFIDLDSVAVFNRLHQAGDESPVRRIFRSTTSTARASIVTNATSGHSMAIFSTGLGDGYYPTWIGRSASRQVACFITQFLDPDA
ncbi:DUF4241 domain-containing protein [Catenulispora rubra]|uniref:DUF4241 domain-containing protein n=1 Tax=Catenulispora rubra TaxID=280293 RepID=UPI0018924C83|nr:DUF4241 domain-containing protein [Catenulispora rubra]